MHIDQNNREQLIEQRINDSVTSVFKVVFPGDTNHHHTMFGGGVMSLMDETSFIAGTRFCRKPLVTVSSGKIDFNLPIPGGTLVELIGKVVRVGRTSLDVQVEVFIESMYSDDSRQKAISGVFTFVALDENKNPVQVID
ncbi:acyl-CoA thioesterase [Chishuiella sp.]|uniref:acyl-CoA thioesterase n=1 Tax=Chishuiella sp. TaxID=1969467 RepID=UPI0028A971DB|nr:acyl-CoA thioesterase [Chishuiella sp.]